MILRGGLLWAYSRLTRHAQRRVGRHAVVPCRCKNEAMAVQELDILNAIETRVARGYRCSTLDEVSDELMAQAGEVAPELAHAAKIGLVRVAREKDGDPCFALTEAGTATLVDGLNSTDAASAQQAQA